MPPEAHFAAVPTPSPEADIEQLLVDGAKSVPQACAFLGGVSRAWVYQQMGSGKLTWVKLGRRRVIPTRALIQFAAERLQGGAGA